jgi:TrmH family RNA methyltransferase
MPRADDPHAADELARVLALRSRSVRDTTGRYYVEGLRQVFRALDAGHPIDLILYCETLAPTIAQQRIRLARRSGVQVIHVSPEQFRGVSIAARASGVGAVLRQHWSSIHEADPAVGLCWVGVGLTRSPGNLGTLLRTAEAAGAAGVVVLDRLTDPFDAGTVRASMGGIFGLGLVRASHEELAAWTARHGCEVIGATPRGGVSYANFPVQSPVVILFGEERRGLTERELELCTRLVSIPIVGRADSLNLGVAAGIMLFDLLRRRSAAAPRTGHRTRHRPPGTIAGSRGSSSPPIAGW